MIWLIFFVVTILGYSSFIFIRKIKMHRSRCEHIRASLHLPTENQKNDYEMDSYYNGNKQPFSWSIRISK